MKGRGAPYEGTWDSAAGRTVSGIRPGRRGLLWECR